MLFGAVRCIGYRIRFPGHLEELLQCVNHDSKQQIEKSGYADTSQLFIGAMAEGVRSSSWSMGGQTDD